MKRLNVARVALKHHGQRPAGDQLIAHLENAVAFVEDVCDKNFDLALSDISIVEIIKNDRVRNSLKEAQEAISRKDLQTAFTKAGLGLKYGSGDAFQTLGPQRPLANPLRSLPLSTGREAERWVRPVLAKIDDEFQRVPDRYDLRINLVSLGINLRSYNRFQELTPTVSVTVGGTVSHVWRSKPSDSIEDARWCVDLVTGFMLRVEGSREG